MRSASRHQFEVAGDCRSRCGRWTRNEVALWDRQTLAPHDCRPDLQGKCISEKMGISKNIICCLDSWFESKGGERFSDAILCNFHLINGNYPTLLTIIVDRK